MCRAYFRRRTAIVSSKNDLTAQDWIEIQQLQDYKCAYCGAYEPLHRDHIVPVSKGGNNTKSNIQGLCCKCNLRKSNKIDSSAFVKIMNMEDESLGVSRKDM